jgi:hypothetical protein
MSTFFHQVDEDFPAASGFQIERDAALVGVEQNEVVGIDAGFFGCAPASLLAFFRLFDFDHVGA